LDGYVRFNAYSSPAGGAGFEIFASGEASVADFLEGLRESYPYSGAATEGAQAIFGRIYQ
jgi:hypothetical protein